MFERRDVDGLNELRCLPFQLSTIDFEEVLPGAVDRCLTVDGGRAAKYSNFVKPGTNLEREVCHRINIGDTLLVHPVANLLGGELGKTLFCTEGLQLA